MRLPITIMARLTRNWKDSGRWDWKSTGRDMDYRALLTDLANERQMSEYDIIREALSAHFQSESNLTIAADHCMGMILRGRCPWMVREYLNTKYF